MTTTTDDQRARGLLGPLCQIPEGKAHMRDLLHHLGGDSSQLLGAIHRAEAILNLKGVDWKPSLHPRDRVGRFAHSNSGGNSSRLGSSSQPRSAAMSPRSTPRSIPMSALEAPRMQDVQNVSARLRETPGKNPPRSELGALRVVYDDFAASTDVVANRLGISGAQALRLLHGLEKRDLIVGMESDDSGWVRESGQGRARGRSGDYIEKTWQSWMTYDNHDWAEVQANARKNGVSETELKPGKTPKEARAKRQVQRVAKPATDRQIKIVANAAGGRFDPVALLKLTPEELAAKVQESKTERDRVLMRNATYGEQSRVRSQVTNMLALQQIQGDENAIRTMLGYMYTNEYKRRSPDLNMKEKGELGRQLGKSEQDIKKGKKTDFVREAIEKEIGTPEEYAARAMQTITGGG